jgi:(1->4)-alpha-D-glucan 1-alpha-D-glucosylmutase
MTARPVPSSTYRVQLCPDFDFAALTGTADYLAELGVGAAYTSPELEAAAGSTHGYDVVDPSHASDQLGGEAGRRAMVDRLRELGLSVVVDIVPNHMDVSTPKANRWWWDVLANGRDSAFAGYFDIDWSQAPVLIPVLADDGDGGVAALDDLKVVDGELRYFDNAYPIAEGTGDGSPTEVHERQHYRLVSWRRAAEELNYRRFFDINNLAGVKVEDPEVFRATHAEILRWVAEGDVVGLRVDHVDGLADPGDYLRRLREHAPDVWLLVEKILAVGEDMPAHWPIDGTTGYDALREVCGVFLDPAGEAGLTAFATELCGPQDVEALEAHTRRLLVNGSLRAEVNRIARLLTAFPLPRAQRAVAELLASFPVYRSYLPDGRAHLREALRGALGSSPESADVLEFVAAAVRAEPEGELAVRLQQTSAMVMAKGVEDTACYRYTRLVAQNEVGGDLRRFGVSVAELHAAAARREAQRPTAMTALATHDTKRGEDVRARLAVLSELPAEFAELVRGLRRRHPLPEPTAELLAWQTVLGAWPISAERLHAYLLKAVREAKLRTNWTDGDAEFEDAVRDWVHGVLDDPAPELLAFVERVRPAGWSNGLGQKLVQLAGPGIPDVYQGTELWDDSLVDPDNRRPVDYAVRRAVAARIAEGERPMVDASGAAKLLVVRETLRLRREHPELFHGYTPLPAEGEADEHVLAFARSGVVAVATRLPIGLRARGGWGDTTLPLPGDGPWTDVIGGTTVTGRHAPLAQLLSRYPVALLRADGQVRR